MVKQYFLNFPSIGYGGYAATNIMARVAFAEKFKADYRLFYDYVVPDSKKAEALAQDLYGDPNYVWVIYLFNDIIDPYYQWPLNNIQFNQLILDKYGSFPNAAQRISYYQNNWFADNRTLDLVGYNALPDNHKKYWRPSLLPGNRVSFYKRAPNDTIVQTNQLITGTATGTYSVGDLVTQTNASGEVTYFDGTTIIIKNVQGAFNAGSLGLGTLNSIVLTQNVIPVDEFVYYIQTSCLDYEQQINTDKANIKLLKPDFLPAVEQSLKQAFQN